MNAMIRFSKFLSALDIHLTGAINFSIIHSTNVVDFFSDVGYEMLKSKKVATYRMNDPTRSPDSQNSLPSTKMWKSVTSQNVLLVSNLMKTGAVCGSGTLLPKKLSSGSLKYAKAANIGTQHIAYFLLSGVIILLPCKMDFMDSIFIAYRARTRLLVDLAYSERKLLRWHKAFLLSNTYVSAADVIKFCHNMVFIFQEWKSFQKIFYCTFIVEQHLTSFVECLIYKHSHCL